MMLEAESHLVEFTRDRLREIREETDMLAKRLGVSPARVPFLKCEALETYWGSFKSYRDTTDDDSTAWIAQQWASLDEPGDDQESLDISVNLADGEVA